MKVFIKKGSPEEMVKPECLRDGFDGWWRVAESYDGTEYV